MPQIARIVLDHDHGNASNLPLGQSIEDFELIHK